MKDGKPSCWHCLGNDHQRKDCPAYKSERVANGNKHVQGAWDKQNPRPTPAPKVRAAPLQEGDLDTEDESESGEPVRSAPLMNSTGPKAPIQMWALPCAAPSLPANAQSESLQDIVKYLVDDEEREMIASLENWAKVVPSKKVRNARAKAGAAMAELIAAVEEKKKLVTRELEELEDDEELVLMDTGCGNHACDDEKHFLDFEMRPSPGSKVGQVFITADETEIVNRGEKVVKFRTQEGDQCQIVVQCAKVSMPIFSIRKLGKTHRAVFADQHKDHGYLEHRGTGRRTYFFSKNGVYFMRIRLTPDVATVPDHRRDGFGRQV